MGSTTTFKHLFFFLTTIASLLSYSPSTAREFPFRSIHPILEGAAINAMDCFNALSEIRSCSNEITAYFTNGTIDISPPCCRSITLITRQCWPAMLSALGITPDQTYILRGYCDATASDAATFAPGPSPLVQPVRRD